MQKNLYSVFDRKANVYSNPFTSINDQVATRMFAHACRDTASDVGMFPNDYSLHFVGVFDDESGQIDTIHPVQTIANGSQFVPTIEEK